MKYKLVLFDLDGTLLDTLPDLGDAINFVLRKYGYKERTYEEVCSFIGNGAGQLCYLSLPENDKSRFEEFLEAYKEYYATHSMVKTKPYDGIVELVNWLVDSGVNVGVLSNKPDKTTKSVVAHYINDQIFAIGESETVKRKPDPAGINKIISDLEIDKGDVIYIGDSEVDIKTCRNAGIKCISVSWGFRTKDYLIEAGAETIVDSITELRAVLKAL